MPNNDVYVAKESFACRLDGKRVIVNRGKTRVRHGHPLLKGREHLFSPIGVHYDVEQATAAPGEVRKVTRKSAARKKTTAKAEG